MPSSLSPSLTLISNSTSPQSFNIHIHPNFSFPTKLKMAIRVAAASRCWAFDFIFWYMNSTILCKLSKSFVTKLSLVVLLTFLFLHHVLQCQKITHHSFHFHATISLSSFLIFLHMSILFLHFLLAKLVHPFPFFFWWISSPFSLSWTKQDWWWVN